MKELRILPTNMIPEISLNPNGIINIRGRSIIGNTTDISKQIESWIDEYIHNPADFTRVNFYLEYLNTNNIKFYISLLNKIKPVKLKNKKYIINWYYEEGDEDILDKGEYISSRVGIPFSLIIISD